MSKIINERGEAGMSNCACESVDPFECSRLIAAGTKTACGCPCHYQSARSRRGSYDVIEHPLRGDTFEVLLPKETADPLTGVRESIGDFEVMIRVMCVVEEHVVYKEYGLGRFIKNLPAWKKMLSGAKVFKMLRGGDEDCLF